MSEEEIENKPQTLGALLRDTRKGKNLALDDAREATKISKPILEAMEADDYDSMPAVAFCRGFYVIYADFLNLDSEKVLARYLEDKGLSPTPVKDYSVPPVSKSGQFSNYAEPSAISPQAGATILLLVCFAAIIGVCWYLNWNPISYINAKLAPTQQTTPPPPPQKVVDQVVEIPPVIIADDITSPEEATEQGSYHLAITFHSKGTLTVTLDNGIYIDKQYMDGETLEWDVEKSIHLEMPEEIDASIFLNGTELPLPSPANGRRTLSLPEDILN